MTDLNTPARVLRVGALGLALHEALTTRYDALVLPDGAERELFLQEWGESITVAVTSSLTGVGSALMHALPSLRAVINLGAGYDSTDIAQARSRRILVSNTPDILTDCVADTALGLTINVLRGFTAADRFVRRGEWPLGNFPLMHRVSHRRVGILGLGRIGRAIATRFEALGCEIFYHKRNALPDSPYTYVETPHELAARVDVLVVATSGGPSTTGLVDRKVLDALGSTGYLINIARGSVVDETALVDMLIKGRIAGAGLDVYADEPRVPEALFQLDNVVVLPHVGSATLETRSEMERLLLSNLARFLADGTVLTPVPEVRA